MNSFVGFIWIIWPWDQRSRSLEGHYGMWHRLMVMHPHTKYNWPIWKDKNVMARRRKYYLKNNYLTLRSKSHEGHYVVMHPHTNYHWPISKDKNVMAQTRKYYLKNNYLTLRSKVIVVRDTPPYGHVPTYEISLTYLERHKSYGPDKLRWEEAEAEEKIRLKQCVSLHSKGRHNYTLENSMCQNNIETSMTEKSMNNP
jgi:hypothetical protein